MTSEAPEEEFSIHWIRDVTEEVLKRDASVFLISTGKSPSGSIHIGIMREIIIADVIKRELIRTGNDARTMFVVDDYDPVRSFPASVSLDLKDWVGIPYSDVVDEFGCCDSFGAHYANELIETFDTFGVNPEIIWTSKLYETPEMQDAVRICLKHTEVIRDIMIEYVANDFNEEQKEQYIESMKNWYPASVVCPKCGHLQAGAKGAITPNRITSYNPESDTVSFECQACGHSDEVTLDKLRVKLVWRVDWPTKWHVLNVTCEPAGKDHSVKGGSYDTGLEVSRRVFDWPGPVKVPYEWVRIGGRDMSTSEGIVFTPRVWLSTAPPELYRYLLLKTDLTRAINIQPERIPDMIDEYERFERVYYGVEDADATKRELAQLVYPLCLSGDLSPEYIPKLPFKFATVISQLTDILGHKVTLEKCEQALKKQYGLEEVPQEAKALIEPRLERALYWVREYGSERDRIEIAEEVPQDVLSTLTDSDREFLAKVVELLQQDDLDEDSLQSAIFEAARGVGIKDRRAFVVIYRILISRKSGPRLAPFITTLGRGWVADRIASVL
jgi:lysyl-tRNA synthetase class 1